MLSLKIIYYYVTSSFAKVSFYMKLEFFITTVNFITSVECVDDLRNSPISFLKIRSSNPVI